MMPPLFFFENLVGGSTSWPQTERGVKVHTMLLAVHMVTEMIDAFQFQDKFFMTYFITRLNVSPQERTT